MLPVQRVRDRRPGKKALAAAIGAAAVVVLAAGACLLGPAPSSPSATQAGSASPTLTRGVGTVQLPASTPHSGYPFDRALTTAELAAFLADPSLKPGTTFAASVTIQGENDGQGVSHTGVLLGIPPEWFVHHVDLYRPQVTGVFALRYVSPGLLEGVGGIIGAPPDQLVYKSEYRWPSAFSATTFLAQGYLSRSRGSTSIITSPPDRTPAARDIYPVIIDPGAGVNSIDESTYHVFVVTAVSFATGTVLNGTRIWIDGTEYHLGAVIDDLPVLETTGLPTTGPRATPSSS